MNFVFDNDRPIYIQLVEQLEKYIVSGKIGVGERLPSVRELALLTKVNPNTMQKALMELETEKLIYTERTNGKFVTTDQTLIQRHKEKFAEEKTEKYLKDMAELGFGRKEASAYIMNVEGEENEPD